MSDVPEGYKTWQFMPLVNGNSLQDAAGEVVTFDVSVPVEGQEEVTLQRLVDGQPVDEQILQEKTAYLLPNQVYDTLKWIGLLFLPTMAWVYTMLASAWNLPYASEIPFTLNVLGTMVAVLIGASTLNNVAKGA